MMKITIPNYHCASRNQTNKGHWTKYVSAKDEVTSLISLYGRIKKTIDVPVLVVITAYFKKERHIDSTNIDDKIYVDALRYAGILKDDNYYYNPVVAKRVLINQGEDKVEIEIIECNPEGEFKFSQ